MQDNIHKGTTAIWGGEAEAFAEGAICVPVFNPLPSITMIWPNGSTLPLAKKPAIFIPGILTQPFVP